MASTSKQKEVKTKWPVVEGTTARTTKIEGRQIALVPEEGSNIPRRKKVGLD